MELTYKVITNGYQIYLNGNLWIEQGEKSNGFFPNRVNNADGTINLEESCKAHIQEILDAQAHAQSEQSQLDVIEANTSYLVMLAE